MYVFLRKMQQAVASNRPVTQRAIAAESGVHEDVVSTWHRKTGFDGWFSEEMKADGRRHYGLAVARGMRRAITTGDPREVEIMGRVTGELAAPSTLLDTVGDRGAIIGQVNNYSINFLVPRPDVPALPGGPR